MKQTINQRRALIHHLKQNPNLTVQMGVPGISIGFKDKLTGERTEQPIAHLETNYNHYLKSNETKRKVMQKELKEHGHTIKSKPRAIRTSRSRTQVTFAGDDWPEGEASADGSTG